MEKRVDLARKYFDLVRNYLNVESSKYKDFVHVMRLFKDQNLDLETVCKRIQGLFKEHKILLTEFNKLIPLNYQINIENCSEYDETAGFINILQETTKDDPNVFNIFKTILQSFNEKKSNFEELRSFVLSLIPRYPSLHEGSQIFLSNFNEKAPVEKSVKEISPQIQLDKILIPIILEPVSKAHLFFLQLNRVLNLNSLRSSDFFLELIKCFELYSNSVITRVELFGMVEPLFKLTNYQNFLLNTNSKNHSNNQKEISLFIENKLKELFEFFKIIAKTREAARRKLGWFFRPLSNFDKKLYKKHGHSYLEIIRPKIPKPENSEINNVFVSVPHGSGDLNFRHTRKNQYEEALFKCEDERFELDLVIDSAESTLKVLKKCFNEAARLSADDQEGFRLDAKVFQAMTLRPIHNIYSEHAGTVIEILKTEPIRSLPVVISRIEEKIFLWKKMKKQENEKNWKDAVDKNFVKSLDHRTYYFKQYEKLIIDQKLFITEAKQRLLARNDSKIQMRKYLNKEIIQPNFDFLGGSKNNLFFNSFSGLTAGMVQKVPENFQDELAEEFRELDQCEDLGVSCPEYATLPHFRLLFSCRSLFNDSIRLLALAVDRSSFIDKSKIDRWMFMILEDFLGCKVPSDVLNHRIEDYFEGNYIEQGVKEYLSDRLEKAKKIINKWIKENAAETKIDEESYLESPKSMILTEDTNYKVFLPLLKDNKVMFCTQNLYFFIRLFYDIYERLLKVKYILLLNGKQYEHQVIQYGSHSFSPEVESKYKDLMKSLCLFIKNSSDSAKFEEKCRSLLGPDLYFFYSLDKLANCAAKSIHSLSTGDLSNKSFSLIQSFLNTHVNEEIYLSSFFLLFPSTHAFRLHWNSQFNILSITYIESPYSKIGDISIKTSQKYKKLFLSAQHPGQHPKEFRLFKSRIEAYLKENNISKAEHCESIIQYSKLSYGMIENSYKLFPVPSGEDFIYNSKYYNNFTYLGIGSELFLCQDKNSLFQKLSENSEKKLKFLRENRLIN